MEKNLIFCLANSTTNKQSQTLEERKAVGSEGKGNSPFGGRLSSNITKFKGAYLLSKKAIFYSKKWFNFLLHSKNV